MTRTYYATEHGLYDYRTGARLRAATPAEIVASADAAKLDGGAGVITDADLSHAVDEISCACGDVYGEPCAWTGPKADTVIVEVMPEDLRASHQAAGGAGVYPHNGAIRIRVERSCADRLVETEDGWASIR